MISFLKNEKIIFPSAGAYGPVLPSHPGFSRGFTLMELVLSTVIFAMMISALAVIYGTIHRHMFQSYRENVIKSNLAVATKYIQMRLMTATEVDSPASGASSNNLGFATNVDAQTGCSPVNSALPNQWHYFCGPAACPSPNSSRSCMYYHTGNVSGTGGCPSSSASSWSYPRCGASGGTVILMDVAVPQSPYPARFFTRASADGINEIDQVRVVLRSIVQFLSGKTVDVTHDTVVHTQTTPP